MFGVDGRHRLRRVALPEAYRVHLDSQLHLIDAFEAETGEIGEIAPVPLATPALAKHRL